MAVETNLWLGGSSQFQAIEMQINVERFVLRRGNGTIPDLELRLVGRSSNGLTILTLDDLPEEPPTRPQVASPENEDVFTPIDQAPQAEEPPPLRRGIRLRDGPRHPRGLFSPSGMHDDVPWLTRRRPKRTRRTTTTTTIEEHDFECLVCYDHFIEHACVFCDTCSWVMCKACAERHSANDNQCPQCRAEFFN